MSRITNIPEMFKHKLAVLHMNFKISAGVTYTTTKGFEVSNSFTYTGTMAKDFKGLDWFVAQRF